MDGFRRDTVKAIEAGDLDDALLSHADTENTGGWGCNHCEFTL
jgi:hypothetical protein